MKIEYKMPDGTWTQDADLAYRAGEAIREMREEAMRRAEAKPPMSKAAFLDKVKDIVRSGKGSTASPPTFSRLSRLRGAYTSRRLWAYR